MTFKELQNLSKMLEDTHWYLLRLILLSDFIFIRRNKASIGSLFRSKLKTSLEITNYLFMQRSIKKKLTSHYFIFKVANKIL